MNFYVLIFADRFVPEPHDAYTYGPFIFIRPRAKDDAGLLAHEKVHVRQFWRTLGLHGLMYRLSKKYRLKSEIEAYRVQLDHEPDLHERARKRDLFRRFIAERYRLGMKPEEVVL